MRSSPSWPSTRWPCGKFEGNAMSEPIIGLVVAVLLGLYLLYTLIHPEKF
ncbi:MAG: K(+)-transporting ATPase subunit F [Hyphomicrobiales bacterium]|nr:K(+)-transporting ATPase subunit F [Hyphomicrobiales bacterium]